jgi:hypothetical protein
MDKIIQLSHVRSTLDYSAIATTTKITNIPHGKPRKQDFIRVHPDSNNSARVFVLKSEIDGATYLVSPGVHAQFEGLSKEVEIFLAVDRSNAPYIIEVGIEGVHPNTWIRSLRTGVEMARQGWVRICSNKNLKCNTKIPIPKKTSARQRRHAHRSICQLVRKKASSR